MNGTFIQILFGGVVIGVVIEYFLAKRATARLENEIRILKNRILESNIRSLAEAWRRTLKKRNFDPYETQEIVLPERDKITIHHAADGDNPGGPR